MTKRSNKSDDAPLELEAGALELLSSYLREHPRALQQARALSRRTLPSGLIKALKSVSLDYPCIRALSAKTVRAIVAGKQSMMKHGCKALRSKDFAVDDYVTIECVLGSDDSLGCWIHTHGMTDFGKPELEVYGVSSEVRGQVAEAFNTWCQYLLRSSKRQNTIRSGDTAEIPDGSVWARFQENIDARTIFHYLGSALEIVDLILDGQSILAPERRLAALAAFKIGFPVEARGNQGPHFRHGHTRVFVPTVADRLQTISNDYTREEELFGCGLVELVNRCDETERARMPAEKRELFEKEMRSVTQAFLNEDGGPRVSIVIPVYRGGAPILECISSINRQSFVRYRPQNVEVIVVQDGEPPPGSDSPINEELYARMANFPKGVLTRIFKLKSNQGRATARNVGVFHATGEIVLFIDSPMILENAFIAEQMLRHTRVPKIALLGFKQNMIWSEFLRNKDAIYSGRLKPDFRRDLKSCHVLGKDEAGFAYRRRRYRTGDRIHYMTLTNNFKALRCAQRIGHRTLPTFFQTNISSAPTHELRAVGGFETGFDSLWGFEDSHLGGLLLATGIKLVPCPSSTAFKIEHEESKTKWFDIKRNRQQFQELLTKRAMTSYSAEGLKEKIEGLLHRGELLELGEG